MSTLELPGVKTSNLYEFKRSLQLRTLLNQQLKIGPAVQIYEFHISKIIVHLLDGLFGPNILTSSQLACQLSWYSAAPVLQRSWVQSPYKAEFFSGLIFTIVQVVHISARIAFIFTSLSTVQIYDFHIFLVKTVKTQ